jgi:hypothetical protein
MKRFIAVSAVFGLLCLTTVGCEPQVTTQRKETVKSPTGTTTTTDTHQVESSGDNPPANAQGETAK